MKLSSVFLSSLLLYHFPFFLFSVGTLAFFQFLNLQIFYHSLCMCCFFYMGWSSSFLCLAKSALFSLGSLLSPCLPVLGPLVIWSHITWSLVFKALTTLWLIVAIMNGIICLSSSQSYKLHKGRSCVCLVHHCIPNIKCIFWQQMK